MKDVKPTALIRWVCWQCGATGSCRSLEEGLDALADHREWEAVQAAREAHAQESSKAC